MATLEERLAEVEEQVSTHSDFVTRLVTIMEEFARQSGILLDKMGALDAKMGALDAKIDEVEERLNSKLYTMEGRLKGMIEKR